MKKALLFTTLIILSTTMSFADTVFDSKDKPIEIKLAPAATAEVQKPAAAQTAEAQKPAAVQTAEAQKPAAATAAQSTAVKTTETQAADKVQTIKEAKLNSALTNLDDAQVELRQELAVANQKYQEALKEKEKAEINCRNYKKEITSISEKMKNVEKSKQIINKNLE